MPNKAAIAVPEGTDEARDADAIETRAAPASPAPATAPSPLRRPDRPLTKSAPRNAGAPPISPASASVTRWAAKSRPT